MSNAPISSAALEAKIGELLDNFFNRRKQSLDGLQLQKKLKDKNPYLFRAIGVLDASEIVEELLDAHISSSDETMFGNEFFEPLGKWVAEQRHIGDAGVTVQVAAAEGCDVLIAGPTYHEAIAVKSGPKVFNAQSRRKQADEFRKIRKILEKSKKAFYPIVGYCYGSKKQSANGASEFRELAGQRFWAHLTGEGDFYLRILDLMKNKPNLHRPEFTEAYVKAKNKFSAEFLADFSLPDGSINWDKLLQLNSGIKLTRAEAAAAAAAASMEDLL